MKERKKWIEMIVLALVLVIISSFNCFAQGSVSITELAAELGVDLDEEFNDSSIGFSGAVTESEAGIGGGDAVIQVREVVRKVIRVKKVIYPVVPFELSSGVFISHILGQFGRGGKGDLAKVLMANGQTLETAKRLPADYKGVIPVEVLGKRYQNPLGMIAKLEKDLESLQRELDEVRALNQKLRVESTRADKLAEQLRAELVAFEDRAEKVKTENARLVTQVLELERKLEFSNLKIAEFSRENFLVISALVLCAILALIVALFLLIRISGLKKSLEIESAKLAEANEIITETKKEKDDLVEDAVNLAGAFEDAVADIISLEKELKLVKTEIDSLKTENNDHDSQVEIDSSNFSFSKEEEILIDLNERRFVFHCAVREEDSGQCHYDIRPFSKPITGDQFVDTPKEVARVVLLYLKREKQGNKIIPELNEAKQNSKLIELQQGEKFALQGGSPTNVGGTLPFNQQFSSHVPLRKRAM